MRTGRKSRALYEDTVMGNDVKAAKKENSMRIVHCVALAILAFFAIGCRKAPSLSRPATIKDIMDSMVDPSGEFVFQSVEIVSDEHGVREIAPHSDADWDAVRLRLIILSEAPNLLAMPGRRVAPPDVKSQNPQIELQPAQIQELIDGDRTAFIRRARGLQDAVAIAMKAVDARNKAALFQAGEGIDKACESCHLHYWYPNDKRAQELFK